MAIASDGHSWQSGDTEPNYVAIALTGILFGEPGLKI